MYCKLKSCVFMVALLLGLSGCALLDDLVRLYNPQTTIKSAVLPEQWQAPLPHHGEVKNLNDFWLRYPNPLLQELVAAAQTHAPDIATALSNIEEARAFRVQSNANLMPQVNASASATRSLSQPAETKLLGNQFNAVGNAAFVNSIPTSSSNASLQALWELDLYQDKRARRDAAISQELAAKAGWHEARVAVAAEVASTYFNYLLCQQKTEVLTLLQDSNQRSLDLTEVAIKTGYRDASALQMAHYKLLDAHQQTNQQRTSCEVEVKNLAALTFIPEAELRQKLKSSQQEASEISLDHLFEIQEIPANVIRQRPDVYRAESELITRAAEIMEAAANRLPQVRLEGSIGWQKANNARFESNGQVWSIGPIQLSLPIFDGGRLKASQDVAEARYTESAAKYRYTLQQAVREIETALIQLHSTEERQHDLSQGLNRLNENFEIAKKRKALGFINQFEVEEALQPLLNAKLSGLTLRQSRANAWLSLYRAAGGGWSLEKNNDITDAKGSQ